jgi:LPXTG-motif cell wall-anchored protein
MKKMKKIFALLLAMVMVLGLSMAAFAEEGTTGDGEATEAVETGSITVKNATKGHTYTAYKVFDATYDGEAVSYKTAADNAENLDDTLFGWSTADKDGNISVWALEDAAEADIIAWVEANYDKFGGTAIPGVFDVANSTVTFSGLDFGYYYITSSLGTAVTIDSAVPDQEVYDKNSVEPVDPVKSIVAVDGEAQDDLAEAADAHVGSVVDFKVTAKTTNWIDKDTIRDKWDITDTPTNMEIDLDSIVVNFNGSVPENYTAVIDDGKLTITVPMVDDNGNSVFDAPVTEDEDTNGLIPIEITYSATITADAGKNPAKNEIPGDETEVFTYAFQVAKTDGDDEPLEGAEFELWSAKGEDGNGAALTFIDNGDGTYTYSADGTVTTLSMLENTTISVLGLDNRWAYTLKEITVPDGYNQAADVSIAGSSLTKVEKDTDTSITSTALYKETVVNKQGAVLPTTGGIGTTIFYILGSILVIGAGVVLVTRRRMDV